MHTVSLKYYAVSNKIMRLIATCFFERLKFYMEANNNNHKKKNILIIIFYLHKNIWEQLRHFHYESIVFKIIFMHKHTHIHVCVCGWFCFNIISLNTSYFFSFSLFFILLTIYANPCLHICIV